MAGQPNPAGHVPPPRNKGLIIKALLRETNGLIKL